MNDTTTTDDLNKSMENLLNLQMIVNPFDYEYCNNDVVDNSESLFDTLGTYSNGNETGVDEDPVKMFSLSVESEFFGSGANNVDFTNDNRQNSMTKMTGFNFDDHGGAIDNNINQILKPLYTLQGHKTKVSACCFDKLGRVMASGSNDNKTIIWDTRNLSSKPSPLWTLEGHKKSVNNVRFCNITAVVGNIASSLNGSSAIKSIPTLLVTGSIDKTVRIWKLDGLKEDINNINIKEQPKTLSIFNDHNWSVTAADFCPIGVCNIQNTQGFGEEGRKIDVYCGSLDAEGELKFWNVMSKRCLKTIKLIKSSKFDYLSNPLRFRPVNNGSFFLSTSTTVTIVAAYATTLTVIDLLLPCNSLNENSTEDYTIRTRTTQHAKYISSLEWSNDGQNLVTASEDIIYVWNIDSNNEFQIIFSMPAKSEKISSCIILPDLTLVNDNNNFNNSSSNTSLSLSSSNTSKSLYVAFSEYDNIYIWETGVNMGMFSQYSYGSSNGKVTLYNHAQSGEICSLYSFYQVRSNSNNSKENNQNNNTNKNNNNNDNNKPEVDLILATSSNSKDNNLKLWKINI